MVQLDNRLEDMEENEAGKAATPKSHDTATSPTDPENQAMDASFMSESIYEKIPSPRTLKHKAIRLCPLPCFYSGPC